MTIEQITKRISEVEPWAPNYFGSVPGDYNEVVDALDAPTAKAVAAYLADEPEAGIDSAIAAAYSDLLPAGYDGVAVDVRPCPIR